MLKIKLKRTFLLVLLSSLVLLPGCRSPEEKKADKIKEASTLFEAENYTKALQILEALSSQYPNDVEILRLMGQTYSATGNHSVASFFLEQALLQAPDDSGLLYQTYLSLEAADQPAAHLLEKLTGQLPEAMTPELWIRLAQSRQANGQTRPALDAYLRAVDPEKSKPDPEIATAIAELFIRSENWPKAEFWLEIAGDTRTPEALPALFKLLELKISRTDRAGAETVIDRLDELFPGAVDASPFEKAREKIAEWRRKEEALKAKKQDLETGQGSGSDDSTHSSEVTDKEKTSIIRSPEAVESTMDAPATKPVDPDDPDLTAADSESKRRIRYNPDIAIEPADPKPNFDEVAIATPVKNSSESGLTQTADNLPTIKSLLADAETDEIERNFKAAIRKYRIAVEIEDNRADIWKLLSRAYLMDGQLKNARTSALEAVRLAPSQVSYTLDYLRIAQRSLNAQSFLRELKIAYEQFPADPTITLSLARAYERISEDKDTAREFYLRFIDLAPSHPLAPEARDAVNRLR